MSIRFTYHYMEPKPEHYRTALINLVIYPILFILTLFIFSGHPHFNILRIAMFILALVMVIDSAYVFVAGKVNVGMPGVGNHFIAVFNPTPPEIFPIISLGAWIVIIWTFVTFPAPILMNSYYGKTAKVEAAIEKGADVNKVQKSTGDTPLTIAIERGNEDIALLLLENNADITVKNDNHEDASWLAAVGGNLKVLQQLVKAGADVKAVRGIDSFGSSWGDLHNATLLWAAAYGGHEDIVKYLLDLKVDVNVPVNQDATPLAIAASEGHAKIVDLLLKAGSFVDMSGEEGRTPLMRAAENGHVEAVKLLIQAGADVHAQTESYPPSDALLLAVENGHEKIVEILLAHDLQEYHLLDRALGAAAEKGYIEIFLDLLEAGVNPFMEYHQRSLLHRAASGGYEITQKVFNLGLNPNARDQDGRTPLFFAKDAKTVEFLLSQGARTDVKANDGTTALHSAASAGNREVVEALLPLIDRDIESSGGVTAAQLAKKNGHKKVATLIDPKENGLKWFLSGVARFFGMAALVVISIGLTIGFLVFLFSDL